MTIEIRDITQKKVLGCRLMTGDDYTDLITAAELIRECDVTLSTMLKTEEGMLLICIQR